ncbi:hypothetical protein GQ607_002851 [Colletotrichum asianum]|uniref:Uncharacterized protein n=1 Tax=Colletotrichum asianum TaxID=702518 RepID=A0A8H3ZRR1_9PEZI|nr:hypothetical protein GQ607_002851 [Colletotrichum asianum]
MEVLEVVKEEEEEVAAVVVAEEEKGHMEAVDGSPGRGFQATIEVDYMEPENGPGAKATEVRVAMEEQMVEGKQGAGAEQVVNQEQMVEGGQVAEGHRPKPYEQTCSFPITFPFLSGFASQK